MINQDRICDNCAKKNECLYKKNQGFQSCKYFVSRRDMLL